MFYRAGLICIALWVCIQAGVAFGHQTNLSRSLIQVEDRRVHYKLELSSHDLAVAVGIKTDLIRPIPRAELLAREAGIKRYLASRLQILERFR